MTRATHASMLELDATVQFDLQHIGQSACDANGCTTSAWMIRSECDGFFNILSYVFTIPLLFDLEFPHSDLFLYYTSISAVSFIVHLHLPFLPDITHSFPLIFIHFLCCPTPVPMISLHISLLFAPLRIQHFSCFIWFI